MASPPTPVPFEIKGGSPMVLEVGLPDGRVFRLNIALNIVQVVYEPDTPNPLHPGQPVFQLQAHLATLVTTLASKNA